MADALYVLAIGSHKGGTGRTTTACALAWLWARDGFRVVLADADPAGAAGLIATDSAGDCPWPNVRYRDCSAGLDSAWPETDVVVVDCPSLMDARAGSVLQACHGVVLTCVADPLALRTIPSAARTLAMARVANAGLELLGVMIGLYADGDPVQAPMLDRLRGMHGEMLLEPPVPFDPQLRDWALAAGSALPTGRGASALEAARDRIADLVWRLHDIELGADRRARRA